MITKRELIEMLEESNVPDDFTLNVSLNTEDICEIKDITINPHVSPDVPMFVIDFIEPKCGCTPIYHNGELIDVQNSSCPNPDHH